MGDSRKILNRDIVICVNLNAKSEAHQVALGKGEALVVLGTWKVARHLSYILRLLKNQARPAGETMKAS